MFERSLYVLRFSDGVVKVGSAKRPLERMVHHAHTKSKTGARIVQQFWSTPSIFGYAAELSAIDRVMRYASGRKGREWFYGVRFGQVVQTVEQTIRRFARKHHTGPLASATAISTRASIATTA